MNAPRDEYLDLCAGYVLGGLSDEDQARLVERLEGGDLLCEAALFEMYAGVLLLAATAPPAAPRPELKSRVLSAIDGVGPPEAAGASAVPLPERRDPIHEARTLRRRNGSGGVVWAVLAAAAAVVVAVVGWSTAQTLRDELAMSRARIDELQGQLTTIRTALDAESSWEEIIGAKNVLVVSIDPTTDEIAQVSGRAYFDPVSKRAVVYFFDVPQMPENSHQMWAIGDAGPKPIGFVHPDGEGHDEVRVDLRKLSGLRAFAVSMEPKGGSKDPKGPSGPVVMMGRIGE